MSWLFSQALVVEYLGDTYLDGEPSVQSSGKNTQLAYLPQDKMTDFSRLSRFGMMFKPLTESRGEELLMSYLGDFHAKTSAQPEEEKVLGGAEAQCGNTWQESLAKLDQDSCLWKTAQCSLLEDSMLSLQIWPKWGSMRNGECFRQPMLVQTTKENEFGWLEKIPTPTASDHKRTPMKEVYANRPKTLGVADDLAKWAVRKSGLAHARLEPALWEWAMGWPEGWTELKPLETDKSLCVQQQHGDC
jgi:hypothetical protein